VIEKNQLYFERYAGDADRVEEIWVHLADKNVRLPGAGDYP